MYLKKYVISFADNVAEAVFKPVVLYVFDEFSFQGVIRAMLRQ